MHGLEQWLLETVNRSGADWAWFGRQSALWRLQSAASLGKATTVWAVKRQAANDPELTAVIVRLRAIQS